MCEVTEGDTCFFPSARLITDLLVVTSPNHPESRLESSGKDRRES